jgi:cell division protein ZapA
MSDKPNLVHVEIFGQTYAVKAGGDPGYVEKLAAYVDEQMREVSRASGAVDSVRVAVLAALNLADECLRLRTQAEEAGKHASAGAEARAREAERRARGANGRALELARELEAALAEPPK